MTAGMNPDLVQRIAKSFLGSYWQERLAGAPHELKLAFQDSFLHRIQLYPKSRIKKRKLEKHLGPALGDRLTLRVPKGKGHAIVQIAPLTKESAAKDLGQVKDVLGKLKTHCRVTDVQLYESKDEARTESDPILQITIELPIENLILFGPLPLGPLESGTISTYSEQLRIDDTSCPHCKAKHLIVYNRKAHAQDSENVHFACRRCGRVELMAFGIPELSSYRIDLEERMPWSVRQEHVRRVESWNKPYKRPWSMGLVPNLQVILAITFLIPMAILGYAWSSPDKFTNNVFHTMRTLDSIACATYGLSLLVLLRRDSEFFQSIATWSFSATVTLLIPVFVALKN